MELRVTSYAVEGRAFPPRARMSEDQASEMSEWMNAWVKNGWSLRHFTSVESYYSDWYLLHTMVWER